MAYVTCTKCDRKVLKDEAVMLEFDQRTNTYTDQPVPAECSQGGFWFGRNCAARVLRKNRGTTRGGHTPGPWRFDDAGAMSGNIIRFDVLAGPETDPFRVAEIDDSAVDTEPGDRRHAAARDLANARLIAAAPDLLDALIAYADFHDKFRQQMPEGNENDGKQWGRIRELARDAIAAVRGDE